MDGSIVQIKFLEPAVAKVELIDTSPGGTSVWIAGTGLGIEFWGDGEVQMHFTPEGMSRKPIDKVLAQRNRHLYAVGMHGLSHWYESQTDVWKDALSIIEGSTNINFHRFRMRVLNEFGVVYSEKYIDIHKEFGKEYHVYSYEFRFGQFVRNYLRAFRKASGHDSFELFRLLESPKEVVVSVEQ